MKTMGLIITLVCFTAFGSSAQDNKNCCCKHKVAQHKVAVHHKTTAAKTAGTYSPPQLHMPANNVDKLNTDIEQKTTEKLPDEPCYTYRQHNIVVTECPAVFYDDAGNMYYGTQGVYLGNYPKRKAAAQQQSNNDDNFKGRAPAGDDLCYQCK